MVLGKKWKLQKKIRVEYVVHIQEIRPWPPSESLKSVQTVLLQWENGTENSGSFLSVAGDSNIVFNESFMLPVTLYHKKGGDKLRKNYLEFSLFAPRNDKPKKLLATAFLNLADYGLIEESSSVRAPLSLRKSGNKSVEPALAVTLEVVERDTSNSSPSVGLSSLNNDDDDDDDYSEMASYTDDDDASSSRTAGSSIFEASIASPSRSDKNGCAKAGADHTRERKRNSWSSSTDQSSDTWNKVKDYVTSSKLTERSMSYAMKNSATPLIISSPTSTSFRDDNGKHNNITSKSSQQAMDDKLFERIAFEAMSADHLARHGVLMNEEQIMDETRQSPVTLRSNTFLSRKGQSVPPTSGTKARLKNLPSDIPNGSHKKGKAGSVIERKEPKGEVCDGKNEWKLRVEMLEDELREAAAIEVGLYSVLAEHSSSKTKVHAPARRLSRFYKNACKTGLQAKRASAAKAAVSGIVLVSKACGNDVPRLTFWLSNSIMLRSIISQIAAELPHSIAQRLNNNGDHTPDQLSVESDDFEDVLTFLISLERVESWLFSRIVESIWWQTFTPNMHPTITKSSNRERNSGTKKGIGRRNSLVVIEHGSFAIELWKKAFKDACLKLCPIRAGGHECGCLSQLLILVMEQLVNRLDVAMFNSILRGSAQETMASDPVSDPISDSKVLPIPPGKSSFTAGAQLKNIIGNWSRWLSDLFGLEDLDEDSVVRGEKGRSTKSAFKAFRLLNALSDLMMLPFGMLADASSRKEVCPTFGPTIIKRVLNNFVPDEFSPNPIPRYLIDALTSQESSSDAWGESVNTYPCIATPTKYTAPPAALLTCVGEVGKQVLKSSRLATVEKSYRSDDELDEVDSPLTTIIPQSHQTISSLQKLSLMPKKMGGTNVVRFQMLREIWRDG